MISNTRLFLTDAHEFQRCVGICQIDSRNSYDLTVMKDILARAGDFCNISSAARGFSDTRR